MKMEKKSKVKCRIHAILYLIMYVLSTWVMTGVLIVFINEPSIYSLAIFLVVCFSLRKSISGFSGNVRFFIVEPKEGKNVSKRKD